MIRKEKKSSSSAAGIDTLSLYHNLFNQFSEGIFILNKNGEILDANEAACRLLGYPIEELLTVSLLHLVSREDKSQKGINFGYIKEKESVIYKTVFVKRDETKIITSLQLAILSDDLFFGVVHDIPDQQNLQYLEERYQRLANNARDIIFRYQLLPERYLEYINPAVETITGYRPDECYADPNLMMNMIHPEDAHIMGKMIGDLHVPELPITLRWIGKDGKIRWMESRLVRICDNAGNLIAVEGITRDITNQKKAEESLYQSEERYHLLFEEMVEAFALHEIILDEQGIPVNYIFLDINPVFEQLTGLKSENLIGKTVLDVLPETEPYWIETYGKVATTGVDIQFENYSSALNKWYRGIAFSPKHGQFATIFLDITESKKAEEKLNEQLLELQRWHSVVLGREERIIEMKKEVNQLLKMNGRPAKYLSAEENQ
ncbi:MAG: PAS domain S-box protein [Flexilinea sp.]